MMWWYPLKQTEGGFTLTVIADASRSSFKATSLPIPKLCDAVRIGRAWVASFDEVIAEDTVTLAATYGITIN